MTGEDADSLRGALFTAIEADDADAYHRLVRTRFADIVAAFAGWTTAPEAVRTDQAAAARYVRALVIIAETFEGAGEPSLMRRLDGDDDRNPIVQWQRRLSHAQALSEAGEYAASNAELEAVLAEMDSATGSAVATLRPKVLGRLGFNALHEREVDAALDFTARAYDASAAAQDAEGLVAYYENRLSLQVIQVLDRDPERGQHILALRRRIAQAQDSTDAGRYQASLATLAACLSDIRARDDDELVRAHLPKVLGLLGYDEYRLGNAARGREQTALALDEAKAVGDPEASRIYAANLALIDEAGAAGE